MKAVWSKTMLFQHDSVYGRRRVAAGWGSALRGAQPMWSPPPAPSFFVSSPQLEREGMHAILVIHTNSMPLKDVSKWPCCLFSNAPGWRVLVFVHRTSVTAPLRCITNQGFNVIEEINLDNIFPGKQTESACLHEDGWDCDSCDLNSFFFSSFWRCKWVLKKRL